MSQEEPINKWDLRFLTLAKFISTWSKDPSTKTGAVIVRPNNSICSVGFNGFPAAMSDDDTNYTNRNEKYSRIIHCEMNAAKFATEDLSGFTLYTYPFMSCDRCFVRSFIDFLDFAIVNSSFFFVFFFSFKIGSEY